ncbi:hypothetical protein SBC1_29900 [Caballeronia sp. SBC1]|nr:hypothetical protein SBC2_30050 [Caballeronia sp. SBC2]QIN62973.1 hypothetical protein SBC1_29900 [Caballeronia sp. SBC1]
MLRIVELGWNPGATEKTHKKKPAATTLRAFSTRGAKTSFAYFTCDILLSADCAASVPPYCEIT